MKTDQGQLKNYMYRELPIKVLLIDMQLFIVVFLVNIFNNELAVKLELHLKN